MCSNAECPNADYCERFTAKRSKRQSFFYFLPVGDKCESFYPNAKYKTFQILAGQDINTDFTTLRWQQIKARALRKKPKNPPKIYYDIADFKRNKI